MDAQDFVTPTPHQLRALTHPTRLEMLGVLRTEGPATATSLARRFGLNTGATSYHLRQLAQHGFVVDDEGRGSGRERWWRAAHASTRTAETPPADPAAATSLEAYLQAVVTVHAEQTQRALEERPTLTQEWRDAATFSDWWVRLTPSRARRLLADIEAVIVAAEEEVAEGDDAVTEEEAAPFVLQLNAFRRPRTGGEDPS